VGTPVEEHIDVHLDGKEVTEVVRKRLFSGTYSF
jgi:hypothetical protein